MFDLRPLSLVIGYMLLALGALMTVPALVDFTVGNQDWRGFLLAAALTVFTGLALTLAGRVPAGQLLPALNLRQAFLLTSLSWIMISLFSALPFIFTTIHLSIPYAIFEATSGFSTTGATVITDLHTVAHGTLVWRGLLQWTGGVGLIITAITVLPLLQIGGMQLFHMESSKYSEEKILPSMKQVTRTIGMIYLGLSLACAISYWLGGMSAFDAVVHMMSTVSTGGFGTSDESFSKWNSVALDFSAILFMFLGSLPVLLFWPALRGKPMALFGDSQVRTFTALTIAAVAIMTLFLWHNEIGENWHSFRYAAFTSVSVITGSGFVNTDYGLLGPFASAFVIFVALIGGCSGSTSCGIKVFRLQILYLAVTNQIKRVIYPNGVFTAHYNDRPLSDSTISSVTGYLFLYLLTLAGSGFLLVALGLDITSALSAAAATLANVGPGMGSILGPTGSYAGLSTPQIWVLTVTMMLGRLELLTVYVLFLRKFWQR